MKKPNHYTSIDDLPQYNWRMISEKNDLTYMLVNRGVMCKEQILKDAFEKIKDEYIDAFGVNETHAKIMQLQANIAALEIDVKLGDRFQKNFLNIARIDLENILKSSGKNTVDINYHLSKHLKFHVDEKTLSVREYTKWVNEMKKELTRRAA